MAAEPVPRLSPISFHSAQLSELPVFLTRLPTGADQPLTIKAIASTLPPAD